MALDKLVDSTQLDADLEDIANAIRTKGGTSAQLSFPADFVSAIAAIPTGGGGGLSLLASGTYTHSGGETNSLIIPVSYTGTATMICVYAETIDSSVSQTYRWASLLYDSMPTEMKDALDASSSTTVDKDCFKAVTYNVSSGSYSLGNPIRARIESGNINVWQTGNAYKIQSNTYKWYIWGYAS